MARSGARDVRGDGEPPALAARPDVGVTAGPGAAVRSGERGPRVDDREIAHEAHVDVARFEAPDRDRPRGLDEEGRAIDERAIRIAAEEVLGQDLVEASDV